MAGLGMARLGVVGQGEARRGSARLGEVGLGRATLSKEITMATNGLTAVADVTNDGAEGISFEEPYTATVTINGTADLLFHRWSNEEVKEKGSGGGKGSIKKKTDNVEAYVWRLQNGNIGLPGEYVRQSIIHAAKYRQDPRSPRKSAMDLFKAGIVSLTQLADLGAKEWDYLDRRRVTIQRAGITRARPAMLAGWTAEIDLSVLLPEYIPPPLLLDVLTMAGRLVGVADFRPTYGRYQIVSFKVN